MSKLTLRLDETSIINQDVKNPVPVFRVLQADTVVGSVVTPIENVDWLGLVGEFESRTGNEQRGSRDLEIAYVRAGFERAVDVASSLEPNETRQIALSYADVERFLGEPDERQCHYQARQARDWFCLAPQKIDPIASALAGFPAAQRTTDAICRSCSVPDARIACRHFSHARVGITTSSDGSVTFSNGGALCSAGRNDKLSFQACRLSGNDCWESAVEMPQIAIADAGPLALHEALEYLSLVWRGKFSQPLFASLPPVSVGGLALDAVNLDGLKARLLELSDVLKAIRIDDSLITAALQTGQQHPKPDETFIRLRLVFDRRPEADAPIRLLTAANKFRNVFGHGHARDNGPTVAATLGVEWPVRDANATWRRIRAVVSSSLAEIRRLLA